MSKILFVNGNLHGHINPTLPVVKELVLRGEEVYYCSTKEFQSKLEAVGAVFLDYGADFEKFLQSFRPHGNHPFYTLMEYMLGLDRMVVPAVLELVKDISFDCILHDVMFGGGSILSSKLQLPSIGSCSSFILEKPPLPPYMLESGYHPQMDFLCEELKAAGQEWQMPELQLSDIFFKRAAKTLVYTSRYFHPMGESYDDSFLFVGPSITDRMEVLDFPLVEGTKKVIYISMGTIMNHCMDFYQKCIEAFSGQNYQVIMSIGNKIDLSDFTQIPENFIIRNYLPQLKVLKHADLMISHGGLNSVSEALFYGVPVIILPMGNDQPAVAKRVTELGAGKELSMKEVTSTELLRSAQELLSDQSYQLHCLAISESFRESGGHKKAADFILNFVKNNKNNSN